jgi:hypothetical protein
MCALSPPVRPNHQQEDVMDADYRETAMNLISIHGVRAQAVVTERIEEARLQGDASGLARWQNVEAAINELRRTSPARV